jgi:hypothetical protein
LCAIIASISLGITVILIVASLPEILRLFSSISSYFSSEPIGSSSQYSILPSTISLPGIVTFEIITLIFSILSVSEFRSGFRILQAIGKNVGGIKGTTFWIVGIILAIIPLIDIVTPILVIIGLILIGLAIRRVGKIYNVSDIRYGGILIAIGAIIPFFAFLGFILTYVGLGKLLNMMGGGN